MVVNGTEVAHAYDATKRREYYLRTRKLKGRKPGAVKPKTKPKLTRAQRQAARTRKLEAQVDALKARLEKLREVMAQLTAEAKARSGVKDTKSSKKTTPSKGKATPKQQTAAQKAKAAKAAEEYREKHKDELLADQVKSLNGKIKTIQERIAKMRKDGSIGAKKK
jgi:chromosome segregation ATPase